MPLLLRVQSNSNINVIYLMAGESKHEYWYHFERIKVENNSICGPYAIIHSACTLAGIQAGQLRCIENYIQREEDDQTHREERRGGQSAQIVNETQWGGDAER